MRNQALQAHRERRNCLLAKYTREKASQKAALVALTIALGEPQQRPINAHKHGHTTLKTHRVHLQVVLVVCECFFPRTSCQIFLASSPTRPCLPNSRECCPLCSSCLALFGPFARSPIWRPLPPSSSLRAFSSRTTTGAPRARAPSATPSVPTLVVPLSPLRLYTRILWLPSDTLSLCFLWRSLFSARHW